MASKRVKVYVDADTRGLDRGLAGASKKLGGFGKAALGAAAGFVGVAGAISEVKKSVGVVTTLAKGTAGLARVTGMETREASRWVAVSRARGIEAQKLTVGFTTLSKQITAANNGTKASAKAFKDLGVSQKTLASGNTSKIIGEVSDGLAKMGPGAERSALASKLFGKSYAALLPMLADGSKKLDENLALSDKYGLTLNGKTSKAALEAAKNQREMNMAFDGLRVSLGSTVVPLLSKATGGIAKFIANARNSKTATGSFARDAGAAIKGWAGGVKKGISDFIGSMNLSKKDLREFGQAMRSVFRALRPVVSSVISGISGTLRGLGRTIGGVVKLITAIIKGDWKGAWSAAKQIVSGVITGIKGTLKAATAPIRHLGKAIGSALSSGVKGAIGGLVSIIKAPINLAIGAVNKLIGAFNKIPGHKDIGTIPKLARGGRVPRSPMQLVGEEGPELVSLPAGSYVHNAGKTRAMLGGGAVVQALAKGGYVRYKQMLGKALGIARKGMPYQWGGYGNPSYDCSGYASAVLNAGGYGFGRQTTMSFPSLLKKGAGKNVTLGIRNTGNPRTSHMMFKIGSRYFESGGGHGPKQVSGWNGNFTMYHLADDADLSKNAPGGDPGGRGRSGRKPTIKHGIGKVTGPSLSSAMVPSDGSVSDTSSGEDTAALLAQIRDELAAARKLAYDTHGVIQTQSYAVLKGILSAVDSGISGQMAEGMRIGARTGVQYA